MKKAEKIFSDALELPAQTRAFRAEKLIESLDTEPAAKPSPEWKKEIEKRCREIEEGATELREAEAVFTEALYFPF